MRRGERAQQQSSFSCTIHPYRFVCSVYMPGIFIYPKHLAGLGCELRWSSVFCLFSRDQVFFFFFNYREGEKKKKLAAGQVGENEQSRQRMAGNLIKL